MNRESATFIFCSLLTVAAAGAAQAIALAADSVFSENPIIRQPYDGKDTYITSYYPSRETTHLVVGGWADWYYVFIQFDLTGLPAEADCVTLRLFVESKEHGAWTNPEMTLWTVEGEWSEGMAWSENATEATYVRDFGAAKDAQWLDIDISDIYRQWMSGAMVNNGLQLRPRTNHANATYFVSSESSDAEHRPMLVVAECSLHISAIEEGRDLRSRAFG